MSASPGVRHGLRWAKLDPLKSLSVPNLWVNRFRFVFAGFMAGLLVLPAAALEAIRSLEPQQVFADGRRTVEVRWRNDAADTVRIEVRLHLFQFTSATAAPVGGQRPWKTLTVLPGQTVVERAVIDFPKLRVATRFAARWLDGDGKLLGVTEIWAHPDNLPDLLKDLTGAQPVGLLDDTGMLRAVLAAHGIPITELDSDGSWKEFRGRLAVVAPKPEANQGEFRLGTAALARIKEGLAVVWLQTPPTISPPGRPLAERVPLGRGAVVLAPASVLDGLDHSPAARLALLRLAELALAAPTQLLASRP